MWTNNNSTSGGWKGYQMHGNEKDNVATRLRGAGYRTGLFGKYLNGYEKTTFVPPGWDDWFAKLQTPEVLDNYFDYRVNDNGTIKHFGSDPSDYSTDVLKGQTKQFINASVTPRQAILPLRGARRAAQAVLHQPRVTGTPSTASKAPRLPSFNEKDVSDKPPWISSSLPNSVATRSPR